MKQNQITFKKRQDVWRSYRDNIYKELSKAAGLSSDNAKISKLIKNINSIDQGILADLNDININISEGSEANIDFYSQYKPLSFEIDNLDPAIIKKIENEIAQANEFRNKSKFIDESGNFVFPKTTNDQQNEEMLENIKYNIDIMSDTIKNFPELAKNDLSILEQSLSIAKSKANEPINPSNKVYAGKIKDSKDLKILYFISVIALVAILVIIIILVVLSIIFW